MRWRLSPRAVRLRPRHATRRFQTGAIRRRRPRDIPHSAAPGRRFWKATPSRGRWRGSPRTEAPTPKSHPIGGPSSPTRTPPTGSTFRPPRAGGRNRRGLAAFGRAGVFLNGSLPHAPEGPMAERDPFNYAAIVAHIGRAVPEDGESAECEAAIDTLCFLEERCQELDADPGPSAHLAILDLAAAFSPSAPFAALTNCSRGCARKLRHAPANWRSRSAKRHSPTRRRQRACARRKRRPGIRPPEFRRPATDRTTPPGALRSPA